MAGTSLSTHVLDTGTGKPAAGIAVSLYRGEERVASGTTDADGRIRELAGPLAAGTYRLVFDLGGYFKGGEGSFFSRVALDIEVGVSGHYHVPALISRYGVVSYRGS